ncbi:MAG: hypothetical protein SVM79_08890, partial [Chloroflexota bacterium]|nr:hypothetical protein [Chloroflexota bacterium]
MAKRKQNTPKSQKSTGWHPLRMIRSRRFWLLVLTAVILGVLIFFSETIGKATFQAFGLGIIVLGAWIATIILMVWQRRFNSVRENWNDWLGIVVLSIALWGILSFFRPSISIAGASMADGTLGGSWGLIIAGTTYAWARLTVMGLVGAILIFPERALILAKGLGRFGWQTIRKLSILTANGLKQLLRKIGVWLGLAFGFLKTEIASLFRSKPSSSKVPSNKKTAAESSHPEIADIEELLSEDVMADMEPEEELLEEEILLPDINRELPPIEILNQAPKAA